MKPLMLLLFFLSLGCESPKCDTLKRCCAASTDLAGVGSACKLSQNVANDEKCGEIVETLGYMYTSKKLPIPQACQLEAP